MGAQRLAEADTATPRRRPQGAAHLQARLDSYKQLADTYHGILSEHGLEPLLERMADTLAELIPHDTLTIYRANEAEGTLVPVLARDQWAEVILDSVAHFGEGLTGWGVVHREPVLSNNAHNDPRTVQIPGTPEEPESLITVPLIARGSVKGALNIYRVGQDMGFSDEEFELAVRFGDAAALAMDNAESRAALERLAQTDSLTGLYNHRHFHERLRAELTRASRTHDSVAVVMLDIDDFKRVNDVYGHAVGDQVLIGLADVLREMTRASDVVCRLGGEELAVILPSCDLADALGLTDRITGKMRQLVFEPAGGITLSVGVAQGPRHAANPRELVACAEAAMMTAKARGKDRTVVYEAGETERPEDFSGDEVRHVRSVSHLKMLQSLAGKLNRLNDVRQIGVTIANELRTLIDYHVCRVYIAEGDDLIPIAIRGELEYKEEEEQLEVMACKFGEGITGRAAQSGRSLLIENALWCEYAVDVPGTDDIDESMVVVPLTYGTRVIGVVVISKLGIGQFDDHDVRLMEVLAGNASVALANARLFEAQRREAEIARALLDFSRHLATAEDLTDVLNEIVVRTARALDCPKASVWLEEVETGDLVAEAVWGYEGDELQRVAGVRVPGDVARSFLQGATDAFVVWPESIRSMKPLIGSSPDKHADTVYAVTPLRLDGNRVGCIAVAAPVPGADYRFSERKMGLLSGIAHQARLAITNASNFDNLERTFLSTVEALANALEAKDEYTCSHARDITDMALDVGLELGLDARALKRLELAALFHDIGKIGIPSQILSKPGPLTDDERKVIETHPELGERILAPIERLEGVRPIVRACHERYDGRGYPDGLAGEDIPIEARIIFVCDAYHAMTTNRPYRAAMRAEQAARRLEQGAATQFDLRAVEAFLRLLGERPAFGGC